MRLIDELTDEELNAVARADRFAIENTPDEDVEVQLRGRLKNLVYGRFTLPKPAEGAIVALRTMVRDDYKALFNAILSMINTVPVLRVEDYFSRQPRLNMDTVDLLTDLSGALNERLDIDCPRRRAAVTIRMAMHVYVASRTLELQPAGLVCFASMQPAEHLTTLIARRRGIPTVTVQHGLYVEYTELETINRINYEHQPSEHFLAWGDETAELIERYHNGVRTKVCGKPEIFTGEPGRDRAADRSIMVITDQVLFDEANRALLDIATRFARKAGLTVKARFHPSNPKAEYMKLFPDLVEDTYFLDCDLVVGHTSSLIYEALTLGKRTLRFATDAPAIALPEESTFSSFEELCEKAAAPVRNDVSRRYIACTGEESLARYGAFFTGFAQTPTMAPRLNQAS